MSARSSIHSGSVDDIANSLRCQWNNLSVEDLHESLQYELALYNRSTVVRMIERAIKRKEKERIDLEGRATIL